MLAGKRAQLQQAELTLQRVQKLRAGNAVTEQEADDKACQVRTLAAEMEAADARVKQLESPAREDELQAARAALAAAKAEYQAAEVALDKMTLRAPLRGQVLDVTAELGEIISPSESEAAIVLTDTSQLRVRAFVEESDALRVTVGGKAVVIADGMPTRTFHGIVRSASPQMRPKLLETSRPDELFDTKVREIVLDLEDSAALLIGLRVDVNLCIEAAITGPR